MYCLYICKPAVSFYVDFICLNGHRISNKFFENVSLFQVLEMTLNRSKCYF